MQQNKTNGLGLIFCPEHGVTTFLRNTIYQTARCHNEESASPHRYCRHNLITSQLWVQFCRCRWQCGLWPLYYRDRGFESRWRHGCCISCVLCFVQEAVSATSWSLVQGSLTGCGFKCVCVGGGVCMCVCVSSRKLSFEIDALVDL